MPLWQKICVSSVPSAAKIKPMSWQQFKTIGQKLHADLAAQHPPAHVRAILKVLGGINTREGLTPTQAYIADRICFELLAGEDTKSAHKILEVVGSMLTRQAMGSNAIDTAQMYADLREEFAPGPLRMILTAAERAGKSTQRRQGVEQAKD